MLKAFFDEAQILTNCAVASSDGAIVTPYYHAALSDGGEIDKLVYDMAMGRDFAGIHYRSSDAEIQLHESGRHSRHYQDGA